jgi:hypothetical protein
MQPFQLSLYTVLALVLASTPAQSRPASLKGIIQGLFQGPSGVRTLGEECHSDTECKNSLMCFKKGTIRHGRCAYVVVGQGQGCKVAGDDISSHNRCDLGYACQNDVCVVSMSKAYSPQGLGEPCYNIFDPKEKPKDMQPATQGGLRPVGGVACKPKLACKVHKAEPNALGRCFPPGGKKYTED